MKYVILWFAILAVCPVGAQDIPDFTARWAMNDDCSLIDESTETPANGILVDVSLTTDRGNRANNALSFGSDNSYITLGVVDKLKITGDKSITFWINPTVLGSARTGSILTYGTGINIRYVEASSIPRIEARFGNTLYAQTNLTPNAWQSVTITFLKDLNPTKSKAAIYVNGDLRATSEQNKTAQSFDRAIAIIGAAGQASLTNGFRGKLDDLRVYSRALTDAEARNIALPVKLNFFKGKRVKDIVEIYWKTDTEENVSHFELLKSINGIEFQKIYQVEPGKINYVAYDRSGVPQLFAWYRLRIVDRDGKSQSSDIIRVSSGAVDESSLSIFPNPSAKYINVLGMSGSGNFKIVNNAGRTVMQKQFLTGSAIDISALPKGLYYLLVFDGNKQVTSKFIKQ